MQVNLNSSESSTYGILTGKCPLYPNFIHTGEKSEQGHLVKTENVSGILRKVTLLGKVSAKQP